MLHTGLIAPVSELLERHRKERPDKVAYWDALRSVTYSQLAGRTASIAAGLSANGVGEGDRIAIYLPNGVDWIEACLAGLRAGAVIVPISYDAAEAEIAYRLSDADCRTVITTPARKELIGKLVAGSPAPVSLVLAGARRRGSRPVPRRTFPRQSSAPPAIRPISTARHSSSTRPARPAAPRACCCRSAECYGLPPPAGRRSVTSATRTSCCPRFRCFIPTASISRCSSVLAVGASEHILERFSPQQALELLQSGKYSVFPGVPTMFHYLLQRAQEAGVTDDLARLGGTRLCISAGAIMPAALNRSFEERFGTTLLDGYGITETSTMVTMNWTSGDRPMGSCGLPVPGLATRIVDPATLEDVPIGSEGELIVRGPNLMHGYHNKPAETATALRKGWYHTGDLAKSDPERLSHDHRPHQGADHQGRTEHCAGRDRGSRDSASRKSSIARWSVCRIRRWAKCHICLSSPNGANSTWSRCSRTAAKACRPTRFPRRPTL